MFHLFLPISLVSGLVEENSDIYVCVTSLVINQTELVRGSECEGKQGATTMEK